MSIFANLTRRHIAALAIGFTTMAVVGGMELPAASAHTAAVVTGQSVCIAPGAWKVTLGVTPTNLDAHPVATIINSAGPYTVHTFPYTTQFTYQTDHANLRVTILWDDNVTYDSGTLQVFAPPGGCEPPTTAPVTTPPTTTCSAAVPPRTDCGVPPVTTVPPVATTIVQTPTSPPDTVMPPTSSPVTSAPHATPAVVHSSSNTVAPVAVLPHTGAGSPLRDTLAAVAVIAVGLGLIVLAGRRRTVR